MGIFRKRLPEKEWEEMNNTVLSVIKSRNLEKALTYAHNLYNITKKEYGSNHANSVTAINNLGFIYHRRPLYGKHIHSNVCFSVGEANFCRTNMLIQGSSTKHTGKQILPEGKPNKGQSSGNKNFQANLLALQILISKSCLFFDFCGCDYRTAVSLMRKEFLKAESYLLLALETAEKVYGKYSKETALINANLSQLYISKTKEAYEIDAGANDKFRENNKGLS